MQLHRNFANVLFPSHVIEECINAITHLAKEVDSELTSTLLSVSRGEESWSLDDLSEWLAEYDRDHSSSVLTMEWGNFGRGFRLQFLERSGNTEVGVTAVNRGQVERVMRIFSAVEANYSLPPAPPVASAPEEPVMVFIGHGHSNDWRKVKDQLQDSHGYKVEAYEVGERAGHSIRDVLDSMLDRSSFALLMMTAEDELGNGQIRARQNVVHEAGLFQGRLGFNRAIAVIEEGVEVFSNLSGVDQILYPSGHVDAAVSRILATLRREFGDRR